MNIKSNQEMNLYEIMEKWTSNLDDNINDEYQEKVIDDEILEPMDETKESTKEFSKNYQKILKELITVNETIVDNNNKKDEINKGVSELVKECIRTYAANKEVIQYWYNYGQEFKDKIRKIKKRDRLT